MLKQRKLSNACQKVAHLIDLSVVSVSQYSHSDASYKHSYTSF